MPSASPPPLWDRYPVLYHLSHAGSWPTIQRHGLLSTERLLDVFEVPDPRRTDLLTRRRAGSVPLTHAVHGTAMIRDQKPLSETKLAKCLTGGLQVPDWLRLINSMVFFWVDPARLQQLREAHAYRNLRQLVLTVDTRALVEAYADRTFVTDRNTGATSPFAAPRGRDTFVPLRSETRRRIVEVALQDGVPDLARFVVTASEEGGADPPRILFRR